MIAYTTVGTNDLARASAFYDALFAPLGYQRLLASERGVAWGVDMGQPLFFAMLPADGQTATVGNGCMVALGMQSPADIDATHARALELGGADAGAAGPREDGAYYCGYFRDLDGNKLNLFCLLG